MQQGNKAKTTDVIKVHTLHNAILKLTRKDLGLDEASHITAEAIKERACRSTPLQPEDLLLVQGGARVADDAIVSSDATTLNYFVLVKSDATRTCTIAAKVTKNGVNSTIFVSVPVSMRVSKLRKELYHAMQKECTIPASAQRLVCRGQILHDYKCVGDFLLTDRSRYTKNTSRVSAEGLPAAPDMTIFVSASVDLSHEVPITLKLLNGQSLREYLAISTPLMFLREILWRQHNIPKDFPMFLYLTDKETGRKQLLDAAKSLYDYEIHSEVTLNMYPYLLIDREQEFVPREGSPVSVASMSIRAPGGASASNKRRSTAKCGPSKSPKNAHGGGISSANINNTATNKSKSAPAGLFGLKKGFLFSAKKK